MLVRIIFLNNNKLSSLIRSQLNQIHTSVRCKRNYFNYEEFSKESDVGRKMPPNLNEKFSKAYKRRPLYWMIRGTDALVEHNRVCLAISGFSFFILFTVICWGYWRHYNNKKLPGEHLLSIMNRKDTPEREKMFDLHKSLHDLGLAGHFRMDHFKDFGEVERKELQETSNVNDINYQFEVSRREDTERDVRKIVNFRLKSLKVVDQELREK